MSIEFENKYIVVKRDDIKKYLNSIAQKNLYRYLGAIEAARKAEGKKNNTYLVVNTDEPYAGEVAQIMQRHGHFTPGGMNCPYCNEIISLNIVQYYPELLYECECGTVVNDEGEDMTDKYYNPV